MILCGFKTLGIHFRAPCAEACCLKRLLVASEPTHPWAYRIRQIARPVPAEVALSPEIVEVWAEAEAVIGVKIGDEIEAGPYVVAAAGFVASAVALNLDPALDWASLRDEPVAVHPAPFLGEVV